MRARWPHALALGLALSCNKEPEKRVPPRRSPSPPPSAIQPPIRNNTVRARQDGIVLELRTLVSTLASGEPVRVALRLMHDPPPAKADKRKLERLNWSKAVSGLTFVIRTPEGKEHALRVDKPEPSRFDLTIDRFVRTLVLTERGLSVGKWHEPVPGLLTSPGKYTLAVKGELATDQRKVATESQPLGFSVKPHGDHMKSLVELETLAAQVVAKRHGLGKPPTPSAPTVDDEKGNRWLRFQLRGSGESTRDQIIELLLEPSGKELFVDVFSHNRCVVEGTRIDTPSGPRRVERLRTGDPVLSFDPRTKTLETTEVRDIAVSHAEALTQLGPLLTTPEHPVYANGRFVLAGQLENGGQLLTRSGPIWALAVPLRKAATVYDLSVGPPNTYFAEGLLVHNKMGPNPVGGHKQPFDGLFYRRAAKKP